MPLSAFHPAVARWFSTDLGAPTPVQAQAWPAIRSGTHALLAAPTGSGKTLAAFLAAIDALVREGLAGGLPDETRVLYVSPLKALSNDIEKNLRRPLAGIREQLRLQGRPDDPDIRVWVRTGDTPQSERAKMARTPPHIVVTTPESLYLMLTAASGRRMLPTVRTVIVDEIHALAGNKRGAHLSLSLERLAALVRAAADAHRPVGDAGAGGADGAASSSACATSRARSSTPVTRASAISRSSCPAHRSRRSCRTKCSRRSTTASPR